MSFTQAKFVSCSRAKKRPTALVHPISSFAGSSTGMIHGLVLEGFSSDRQTASTGAAKRPNNIQDAAAASHKIQLRKPEKENDLQRCSSQIPAWGKKRARSALLLGGDGDDLLLRSSQIPPIWGAKRARSSAIIRGPDWRDWTDLGEGPAGLIAERLLASDVADYVSFRAVCRPWRLCCADPRAHGVLDRRFHPRQWIMLRAATTATGVSVSASPLRLRRRSFLNVSTGCCRHVDLPELRGHRVFGPTSEGLLVLLDVATCAVRLLNSFTRQAATLPPATALMSHKDLGETHLRMVLLSVAGAGLADDDTFAVYFHMMRTLAVVRPGDAQPQWTVVNRGTLLFPAISFAGRFYCATSQDVMVVETGADADRRPPRLTVAAELSRPFSRVNMDTVHLVDNAGELMLVDCEYPDNGDVKYNVHRVDLDARKMVPAVRGLDGRAVFIGLYLALSVSPLVFPSISADSVYLSFESHVRNESPIHLMDGASYPRQWETSINARRDTPLYGPSGLDYYLSRYVTGYADTLENA